MCDLREQNYHIDHEKEQEKQPDKRAGFLMPVMQGTEIDAGFIPVFFL